MSSFLYFLSLYADHGTRALIISVSCSSSKYKVKRTMDHYYWYVIILVFPSLLYPFSSGATLSTQYHLTPHHFSHAYHPAPAPPGATNLPIPSPLAPANTSAPSSATPTNKPALNSRTPTAQPLPLPPLNPHPKVEMAPHLPQRKRPRKYCWR